MENKELHQLLTVKEEILLKDYKTDEIRNILICSHSKAGKTTFAETVLFNCGLISRLGKVEDGTTVSDYDPEEVKRQVSINATTIPIEWKSCKINFIDTPGYFDFIGELYGAASAAEGAMILVDAHSGVEVGTEIVWKLLLEKNISRMIAISKMDRENTDFFSTLESLREKFGTSVVPIQLPIGRDHEFTGFVDLVEQKAYYAVKNDPKKFDIQEIPLDMQADAAKFRDMLIESAAECDDELLLKYLDGTALTDDEVRYAVKKGTFDGNLAPVICTSSAYNIGINQVLDHIVNLMPSPAKFAASVGMIPGTDEPTSRNMDSSEHVSIHVFKTITDPYVGKLTFFKVKSGTLKQDAHLYNVNHDETERLGKIFFMDGKNQVTATQIVAGDIAAVAKLQFTGTGDTLCEKEHQIIYPKIDFPEPMYSLCVMAKEASDEDKINAGLHRLAEEDPTIRVFKHSETHQLILSGIGDLQLEVVKDRLKRKFGVVMDIVPAKVPYRETIRIPAKVEGKHKKQSGGHGQFGHVWIEFLPLMPGQGFEFSENIFGGSVPKQYVPAVEKGLRESLSEGILAGYPVVDLKAILYDGSYHPVDSSEMAFKIAAHVAFKKGMEMAKSVILEPIMLLSVSVPDSYMGDVIGDINSKRGRILGMEPTGSGMEVVKANVPYAELTTYALDLRSITHGRGSFSVTFSSYEEVPERTKNEIVEAAKAKMIKTHED